MKKLQLAVAMHILLFAACTQAASFDCAKATAPIEKLICSDATTSQLDADLAGAYKAAMEKTENKDALKQQQRKWLKEKRNACKDAACLNQAYQSRIATIGSGASAIEIEGGAKTFITFTLLEGEGYPLCKEYVEMLNKTQYTEIPACSRKILPEFKNFQEMPWIEITDKGKMIKITEERMAVQAALNPTHSKQMYDPIIRIKPITENRLKMYFHKMQINDGAMDVVYRNQVQPKNYKNKYGHCPIFDNFYVDDSKISIDTIKPNTLDPYGAFNINGSNELFIYGGNLYISIYKGTSYSDYNFIVYGIGNKKMCEILAK